MAIQTLTADQLAALEEINYCSFCDNWQTVDDDGLCWACADRDGVAPADFLLGYLEQYNDAWALELLENV